MPIAPPKHKTKRIVKDRYHAPETIFIPQHKGMYGYKWKRQREAFLRINPICKCGKVATVVDHIVPHKGNVNLFWDQENWQPMCTVCHNRKTATYDGGFGRKNNVDNKKMQY